MWDSSDHFRNIYAASRKRFACHAKSQEEFSIWRKSASSALRHLLGLNTIAEQNVGHVPTVSEFGKEEFKAYTRHCGIITSEIGVNLPFWILTPTGAGPHPIAIAPHGHTHFGADQYVGISSDASGAALINSEERDVAVQAAERGFLTIAPVTRGFAPLDFADTTNRHDGSSCRAQLIHALLAGRTALGERLWDLTRILDWVWRLDNVDRNRVVVLGNSGGCVLSCLLAASDWRVTVCVMNCCFCTFVGENGMTNFCDCNTVPGMMLFGDFQDIAGLIAPRSLLVINGSKDVHPVFEVEKAVQGLRNIYSASGESEKFLHIFAEGGCRFYKSVMWPFIDEALKDHLEKRASGAAGFPANQVSLRQVDSENVRQVCELLVAPEQAIFVAPNAVSLAQASFRPDVWCRAVYVDDVLVGFFMVAEEADGVFYLWRFMIGASYQRRGFGSKAIDRLIDELRTHRDARELYVSYVPLPGNGRDFYIAHGFRDLGEYRGTDRILRRDLVLG